MSTSRRGNLRSKFTKYQIETAIKVMMGSKSVCNWVDSEVKFLKLDVTTKEGQERYENLKRIAATKMIQP